MKNGDVKMTFWMGLIIGFIGGVIFGVIIMALCIAAKNDPYKGDRDK